ncbi:MAG: hypothetical protein ACRC9R_05420, partial [Enterovibrio sp.]
HSTSAMLAKPSHPRVTELALSNVKEDEFAKPASIFDSESLLSGDNSSYEPIYLPHTTPTPWHEQLNDELITLASDHAELTGDTATPANDEQRRRNRRSPRHLRASGQRRRNVRERQPQNGENLPEQALEALDLIESGMAVQQKPAQYPQRSGVAFPELAMGKIVTCFAKKEVSATAVSDSEEPATCNKKCVQDNITEEKSAHVEPAKTLEPVVCVQEQEQEVVAQEAAVQETVAQDVVQDAIVHEAVAQKTALVAPLAKAVQACDVAAEPKKKAKSEANVRTLKRTLIAKSIMEIASSPVAKAAATMPIEAFVPAPIASFKLTKSAAKQAGSDFATNHASALAAKPNNN